MEGRSGGAADAGQIARIAAVIAANDQHQIDGLLTEQRDDRVLPILRRAAYGIEGLKMFGKRRLPVAIDHCGLQHVADFERLGHQHGGLIGESDAYQIAVGIEPRRHRLSKVTKKGARDAAVPDVVAHLGRLSAVEHDQEPAAVLDGLRGGRARFFVPRFAVNNRRVAARR